MLFQRTFFSFKKINLNINHLNYYFKKLKYYSYSTTINNQNIKKPQNNEEWSSWFTKNVDKGKYY